MSGGGDAPPTSGGSAQNRQHAGGRQTSDETCQQDGDSRVTQQPEADTSAELRSRMQQRLTRARFRYINEQLYTRHSQEAAQLFQEDPEAFSIYHSGFSQQLQRWPLNPITQIIKYIKNRPPSLVIADFGCGDALLARSVRNIVHSFDLVALNDRVTVCDMAEVPLPDGSVDVAVFCLSLMGKNLSDFLREANRVLKTRMWRIRISTSLSSVSRAAHETPPDTRDCSSSRVCTRRDEGPPTSLGPAGSAPPPTHTHTHHRALQDPGPPPTSPGPAGFGASPHITGPCRIRGP
ncbi:hypothetical protein GDO81_020732 [Engystomops pustulosus]|uniref:Ribosomal RNA-processing protein 8 n=1 Tax=Engystomops pustulosus TaxID=76066 RepID=A0AAV6YX81_ENGPU|nr:hypothetical protein GDO81_020732 [Engystomops pustulosus]